MSNENEYSLVKLWMPLCVRALMGSLGKVLVFITITVIMNTYPSKGLCYIDSQNIYKANIPTNGKQP